MKRFVLFLSFIVFSILLSAFTVLDPLDDLLLQLKKYTSERPQEKVHLHLDKPFYAGGDTIWFKAYIVNAEENALSDLSKILYVDLIDAKDSIRQTLKLPVVSGLSWGSFTLTDTIKQGKYRIRAYTRWMRNFDESYFFNREFDIISWLTIGNQYTNDAKNKTLLTDSKSKKENFNKTNNTNTNQSLADTSRYTSRYNVQFFPEGGNLVEGIASTVGVKVLGLTGHGFVAEGYIQDNNKHKIAEFTTSALGMGAFRIVVQPGQTYTAVVKSSDRAVETFPLPTAKKEGFVLSVNNESADLLNIQVLPATSIIHQGKITVIGAMNGTPYYISQSIIDGNVANARVDKNRFPTGILHLTLFSAENIPVAERLVFIQHHDALQLNISLPVKDYKIRDKVTVNLSAKDTRGKPVIGSFSIAVTDDSKIKEDEVEQHTIFTDLLLTSDLKGRIENPNYYFIDSNPGRLRELDLLMLTQGWSRYTWKDLIRDSARVLPFKPENGIDISGLISYASRKPVTGGKLTLFSLGNNRFSDDTSVSTTGRFKFQNLNFEDSTRFILQARDQKNKRNLRIDLDDNSPARVHILNTMKYQQVKENPEIVKYRENSGDRLFNLQLLGLRHGIQLKEIVVKAKKTDRIQEVLKSSRNLNGAGNADRVLTYLDFQYCQNLEQCLQGKVAGVMINNGKAYSARSPGRPMLIILDGMQMTDMRLDEININDIGSVEILKNASYLAIYGSQASGGALVITSKTGGIDYSIPGYKPAVDLAKGFLFFKPLGYAIYREFYSPAYPEAVSTGKTDASLVTTGDNALSANKISSRGKLKDLRTTIYWKPNLITDTAGKSSVTYYNSDGKGLYHIVVEGISPSGTVGRQTLNYTVK